MISTSLLFIAEVLQRPMPCALVVTMVDELAARGGQIDFARREAALGIPVLRGIGHRGVGIEQRERIGIERILWSSDYPHISADWPHSWRTIEAAFDGVDADEQALILAGNAQRLYGFGTPD